MKPKVPTGKVSIKCIVQTDGKSIGVVVKKDNYSQGFVVYSLQDLEKVNKTISEFIKNNQ